MMVLFALVEGTGQGCRPSFGSGGGEGVGTRSKPPRIYIIKILKKLYLNIIYIEFFSNYYCMYKRRCTFFNNRYSLYILCI